MICFYFVYNSLWQIETVRTGQKGAISGGLYTLTGEVRETAYTYDDLGRTTAVTDSGSGVSSVVFDSLGRITSMKDPKMKVTVLPKDNSGKAVVRVRNASGAPLKGVTVYVNTSTEKNDMSYTDGFGKADIIQKPGTYRIAFYKPGYVAVEKMVEIEMHGEREYVFTLEEGETVTADFTVQQMTKEYVSQSPVPAGVIKVPLFLRIAFLRVQKIGRLVLWEVIFIFGITICGNSRFIKRT